MKFNKLKTIMLATTILTFSGCGPDTPEEAEAKLKKAQDVAKAKAEYNQKIVKEKLKTNTETIIGDDGHKWIYYLDSYSGSITHHPDCSKCLERQEKMMERAVREVLKTKPSNNSNPTAGVQ